MSPARWREVSDLFDRAADLPPAERAAFLDREALGADGRTDAALREEVESLLASDVADGYLGAGVAPTAPLAPPPEAGPWALHERIGRGGMGEVWRASRPLGADGLRQSAAVKLVHPGLGEPIAARFRAERRILAGLDHPAIARLLDAGTASDGRPYLATELVRGEPITRYADRRRLGVNERLALFGEVCEAVAYAHARLVVHRDLKPGNILVASGEGDGAGGQGEGPAAPPEARPGKPDARGPRVKLLDFGIAKLLGADGDDLTRTARAPLTPAYAAPEQRAGGAVTTATDVYGLGVLLYELLTGRRPSADDLTRPSEAVTTSATTGGRVPRPAPEASGAHGEGAPMGGDRATGALRATTPERLRRRLRGDLDRICLKALRADPERRYRGAAELGADVQRHLDGLPIEARPESAAYRAGKFVRRNRAAVAVAAAALVAVLGASGAAVWQGQRAVEERRAAEAVSAYLVDLFQSAGDAEASGAALSVYDVFERGAARVETGLADQPAARAAVHDVRADVYFSLGRFEDSAAAAAQADSLWSLTRGPRSPEALRSRSLRGRARVELRDREGAEALLRSVLREQERALGAVHDHVADTQAWLAEAVVHQGRPEEVIPLYRQALATRRALHGEESPEVGAALDDLGFAFKRSGDLERGRELYLQALAMRRRTLGDVHVDVANTLGNLSTLEEDVGRTGLAHAYALERARIYERVYGAANPRTLRAYNGLGSELAENGAPEAAVTLLEPLLAEAEAAGPQAAETAARIRRTLGIGYLRLGRLEDAREAFKRTLEAFADGAPTHAGQRALGHRWLMETALARGDRSAALRHARETLAELDRAGTGAMPNSRRKAAAYVDSLG